MTGLKLAHRTRARHDGGSEARADHACAGNPWPYDVLIDGDAKEVRVAIPEARRLCGTCPMQAPCHTANRDEEWLRVLIAGRRNNRGGARKPAVDPIARAAKIRANNARYTAERNARRLAELTHLADAGATLPAVLTALDITRESLREWCRRNGHSDLWVKLGGRSGQSWRKDAA